MSTISERHATIKEVVNRNPDNVANVSAVLWEKLASELVPIIGEEGFATLYARSVHKDARFPMSISKPTTKADAFATLKAELESCDSSQAIEVSVALFITFLDILAQLIGDQLTFRILVIAWGEYFSPDNISENSQNG